MNITDFKYGITNEFKVISYLQSNLVDIKNIEGKYSLFDFKNEDETIFYELKSRRIHHDKYDDIMMGLNKFEYCLNNPTKEFIFLFLYTDGLYQWKFRPNSYTKRFAGRQDRGVDERKMYGFIKTEELEYITNEITSLS